MSLCDIKTMKMWPIILLLISTLVGMILVIVGGIVLKNNADAKKMAEDAKTQMITSGSDNTQTMSTTTAIALLIMGIFLLLGTAGLAVAYLQYGGKSNDGVRNAKEEAYSTSEDRSLLSDEDRSLYEDAYGASGASTVGDDRRSGEGAFGDNDNPDADFEDSFMETVGPSTATSNLVNEADEIEKPKPTPKKPMTSEQRAILEANQLLQRNASPSITPRDERAMRRGNQIGGGA
jgi:hypothetical protein